MIAEEGARDVLEKSADENHVAAAAAAAANASVASSAGEDILQ